ncbi:hypothetical protein BLNAU_2375 [Blattamonas nauphoetae]|uniref:Uncharacterized protein n=1 Tax=Blattamonas nauphoetae TaxID=2049346 RepID=A0ABQ9YFR0_9EUKA|nr:hypothetical protein BLNAU_2375 [Blattamonas nauphoetae]
MILLTIFFVSHAQEKSILPRSPTGFIGSTGLGWYELFSLAKPMENTLTLPTGTEVPVTTPTAAIITMIVEEQYDGDTIANLIFYYIGSNISYFIFYIILFVGIIGLFVGWILAQVSGQNDNKGEAIIHKKFRCCGLCRDPRNRTVSIVFKIAYFIFAIATTVFGIFAIVASSRIIDRSNSIFTSLTSSLTSFEGYLDSFLEAEKVGNPMTELISGLTSEFGLYFRLEEMTEYLNNIDNQLKSLYDLTEGIEYAASASSDLQTYLEDIMFDIGPYFNNPVADNLNDICTSLDFLLNPGNQHYLENVRTNLDFVLSITDFNLTANTERYDNIISSINANVGSIDSIDDYVLGKEPYTDVIGVLSNFYVNVTTSNQTTAQSAITNIRQTYSTNTDHLDEYRHFYTQSLIGADTCQTCPRIISSNTTQTKQSNSRSKMTSNSGSAKASRHGLAERKRKLRLNNSTISSTLTNTTSPVREANQVDPCETYINMLQAEYPSLTNEDKTLLFNLCTDVTTWSGLAYHFAEEDFKSLNQSSTFDLEDHLEWKNEMMEGLDAVFKSTVSGVEYIGGNVTSYYLSLSKKMESAKWGSESFRGQISDFRKQFIVVGNVINVILCLVLLIAIVVSAATSFFSKWFIRDGPFCCFLTLHLLISLVLIVVVIIFAAVAKPLLDLYKDLYRKQDHETIVPLMEYFMTAIARNFYEAPQGTPNPENPLERESYAFLDFNLLNATQLTYYLFPNSTDELDNPFTPFFDNFYDMTKSLVTLLLTEDSYLQGQGIKGSFLTPFLGYEDKIMAGLDEWITGQQDRFRNTKITPLIYDITDSILIETGTSLSAASLWIVIVIILIICESIILMAGRTLWRKIDGFERAKKQEKLAWKSGRNQMDATLTFVPWVKTKYKRLKNKISPAAVDEEEM